MAVTAKFQADFSSFYEAVQKAEVELRSFEQGAGRVEKSLNRMVDTFSGRKVIQDATLMTEAVERIGGTSKLTERELQALGARAQEAIAKMRALGVDVPAGLQKIADGAKQTESGFRQILSAVGPLGTALAGAFSVGAIVNFGRELLADADALTRMADQTGVGIEGLQRLRAIADESGNSLDQLTSAISQMQNRLAEGDTSAVGALERLGISLSELRRQAPDQQFLTIARAVAEIEDPAERTRAAMDLFGKTGAQILPSLRAEVDKIVDSTTVMADQTVKKLDQMGDAWTRFVRGTKATIANLLITTEEETKALQHMSDVIDGFAKFDARLLGAPNVGSGLPLAAPLNVPGLPSPEIMRQSDEALRRLRVANDAMRESQRKARQEHDQAVRSMAALDLEVWGLRDSVRGLGQQWGDLNESLIPTTVGFQDMTVVLRRLGDRDIPSVAEEMKRLHEGIETYGPTMEQAGRTTRQTGNYLQDIESILGNVQTRWAQMATVAVRGIQAIYRNLVEGDWLGAAISGVAAFGNAIANAFRDEEWERVNDMRDAFEDTFGTFDDMAKAAARAGYQIERLLDARKVEDFQREMRALTDAIAFQDEAMRFLDETTKKYGFSIEELGPAFRRQELDKQAQLLFKEFEALTGAQIDSAAIFERMSENVSAFVQQALRTGTEIPAAMRPMLEQFAASGRLLDENGNAITDLEAAGVQWALTMSEGFRDLIAEVKKLTDAIARGLGLAIEQVPDLNIDVRYNDPGFNPQPASLDVVPMASGGRGRVTRPTLFLAGEAGPEDYAFSGANRAFRPDGSGDGGVAEELRALRNFMMNDFARLMARATVYAVQT